MKKYILVLLAVLGGILLSIGWPARGIPVFLFIGFVPLLFIEHYIAQNRHKFHRFSVFIYSYLMFFIWNLLTTWWIYYASFFGAAMAVIFNSLFMAMVFHIYHIAKKHIYAHKKGCFLLIVFWLGFEYLHLHWELSWTWLTLGNGLAKWHQIIQWYEFTGVFGGSLWILVSNILLFKILLAVFNSRTNDKKIILGFTLLFFTWVLPVLFSFIMYNNYKENEEAVNIVIIQPNNDPYTEQYTLETTEIVDKIKRLSAEKITKGTDFILCPESVLQEGIWQDRIQHSQGLNMIREWLREKHPDLTTIIGGSSYRIYEEGEEHTVAARELFDGQYFEAYNTAFIIDTSMNVPIYHKSKFVVGVEHMPFKKLIKPIEKFAIDLGGTVGSLGVSKERDVFVIPSADNCKVSPMICYESIYGEFVTGFVKNGAELLFIMTNDGWWEETAGHRQHFIYAKLRAIECRRSIARSANTGISCFINQRGDVIQQTAYWEEDAIQNTINKNDRITFYVKYGDVLGRLAYWTSGLLILILIVAMLKKRFTKKTI